jgi:ureidoglycolate hydrolase
MGFFISRNGNKRNEKKMSISGYARLTVTRQFPLKRCHVVPIQRTLPSESYVHALYKRHWPITKDQTFTQPIQLRNGDIMYSDPTVASGDFVTGYQKVSKNISHVVSLNEAVNRSWYKVAIQHTRLGYFLREMNHHPDSSQHFFHHDSHMPFMILLAPPKTELDVRNVTAYLLNHHGKDPQGLVIAPGVWHSPPIPMVEEKQTIFTQQTRSHNCILWDTLLHDSTWLTVQC